MSECTIAIDLGQHFDYEAVKYQDSNSEFKDLVNVKHVSKIQYLKNQVNFF